MAKTLTLSEVAVEGCKDELTDYTVYKRLAGKSKNRPKQAEIFTRLSNIEYKHYEFWRKYCPPDAKLNVSEFSINLIMMFRVIFGTTFAIKFLEKHESTTIQKYKSIENLIPPEDKTQFSEIVKDEEEHEIEFAEQVRSGYIIYISFVILGLADAIVEISGIHAGSLGIYNSTKLTGLAGIVAGAAASLAMASAAFAQAKQGFQGSPLISAIFTGISYFVNAVILATPYFLTENMSFAITFSVMFAIVIIAFTSYYNSVISGSRFVRDFAELAGIMLSATVALYFFGELIRTVFGITI